MARNSRTRGLTSRLRGGRVALASAALATFTILGGTALADELTTESINQASDGVALEAPATWMAPTLLGREQERRGNDDGARHARNGADDQPGDDRGSDRRVARNGADDGAGDDRGSDRRVARNGADDQPGDDRGGHGNDDGALHA